MELFTLTQLPFCKLHGITLNLQHNLNMEQRNFKTGHEKKLG